MSRNLRTLVLLCAILGVTTSSKVPNLYNLQEADPSLGEAPPAEEGGATTGTETANPAEPTGTETGDTNGDTGTETPAAPTETETPGEPTEPETSQPTGTTGPSEEATVLNTAFTVGEETDWLFPLAINNPPEDKTTIQFTEGDEPAVGMGGKTTSFEFRQGSLQPDGMFEIPVYVTDHEGPKDITFIVTINGKDTTVTVSVKAVGPLFKVQQNPVTVSEQSQWSFTLRVQAKTEIEYTFKEGDNEAAPEGNTPSLTFGSLVHKAEGNIDEIQVTVTDLSRNNLTFDVTSGDTTETVTVTIVPPAKPMLLTNTFSVSKDDEYTFTLEIKSKSMPEVSFKEGDEEVKAGETTKHFTFGTMTQDVENLYEVKVKVSRDIDDLAEGSWKFNVIIDREDNEVTVIPQSPSSGFKSASFTLACFMWPLVVIFLL